MSITLTQDQEKAKDAFMKFYNSDEQFFIIEGYAGTGKTTLVKHLLEHLNTYHKTLEMIGSKQKPLSPVLTATTNKASESLETATGLPVTTIHTHLGLYLATDYHTGESTLKRKKSAGPLSKQLIFIDEASYIDKYLLSWIRNLTKNCKVVFMGDSAQLTPVKCTTTPAFDINCDKVNLSKVVRQQDGNPIKEICELLRHTIKGGEFPDINIDGIHIVHVEQEEFEKQILNEFTNNWQPTQSRVLAWTNNKVHHYNKMIYLNLFGSEQLQAGQYVLNNTFVKGNSNRGIGTDHIVKLQSIRPYTDEETGVQGHRVKIDNSTFFLPPEPKMKKKYFDKAIKEGDSATAILIDNYWCDLRPVYACTVNKSQGSTYDKVYIDINDIAKCRSNNQVARLLYVAISRARHQVILTGDLA